MSDGATAKEAGTEEAKRAECAQEPSGSARDLGPIEQQVVRGVESAVRAVGTGVKKIRAAIRERVPASPAEPGKEPSAAEGGSKGFQVPDEVRGLVERYPLPAILASCGAGYLLGVALGGRRRE